MAFCPKCNAEISATAVRCSECGYDFPSESMNSEKTGIAYSSLADVALFIGSFVAGVCCIGAMISVVAKAMDGNYLDAFVTSPVVFFLSLAMLVVFIRTADQSNAE